MPTVTNSSLDSKILYHLVATRATHSSIAPSLKSLTIPCASESRSSHRSPSTQSRSSTGSTNSSRTVFEEFEGKDELAATHDVVPDTQASEPARRPNGFTERPSEQVSAGSRSKARDLKIAAGSRSDRKADAPGQTVQDKEFRTQAVTTRPATPTIREMARDLLDAPWRRKHVRTRRR